MLLIDAAILSFSRKSLATDESFSADLEPFDEFINSILSRFLCTVA
jgi:hypothetical protein